MWEHWGKGRGGGRWTGVFGQPTEEIPYKGLPFRIPPGPRVRGVEELRHERSGLRSLLNRHLFEPRLSQEGPQHGPPLLKEGLHLRGPTDRDRERGEDPVDECGPLP